MCILNNDHDDAAEAFKKMHKLSDQSIYAKPEQYFDYANFLVEQTKRNPDASINSTLTKQAFDLAESIKKRFSTQANVNDQSKLASAQIHLALGNTEEANAIIETVLTEEKIETYDAKTLKIASSVVKASGKEDRAEQLLIKAADKAENDPLLIAEIYDQLNRDISLEQRKEAALKNKEGIQFYSNNQLEQATAILKQALELTPRHISLNLNLIQVLLKLAKQSNDTKFLNEANLLLKKIRHIPQDHREYRRFQFLSKKLKNEVQ